MKFNNTVQVMQELGAIVVKKGKANLQKEKKQTRANTLYNDFDYLVSSDKKGVFVEWEFVGAEDYWNFVDEGVEGKGGYVPGKGAKKNKSGDARGMSTVRGKGSPFKFKKKNIKRGVILKWIANKPLKLRNEKGQFEEKSQANLKSAAFLIGRAIAQRGLTRTLFFTKPYNEEVNKYENKITQAFADDLEIALANTLKD